MKALEEKRNKLDKEKANKINRKEIFSWIRVIFLAVVISFVMKNYLIINASVTSGSMENTIMTGNRLIANRLAYTSTKPQRGDIVVFKFPDDESKNYVKRVIGLSGETIEGKDGLVYIDGQAITENYVTSTLSEDFGPYKIPIDSYFMMGDNRGISYDSRYWNNKFVHKDKILGRVSFTYFPDIEVLSK